MAFLPPMDRGKDSFPLGLSTTLALPGDGLRPWNTLASTLETAVMAATQSGRKVGVSSRMELG